MSRYTITETKREAGRVLYFVQSEKGTDYAVYTPHAGDPWELATLAKTAHGRAWRWAKDTTRGAIAEVLAFTRAHHVTANNQFDDYGRLLPESTAADWVAHFEERPEHAKSADPVRCTIIHKKTQQQFVAFGALRSDATVNALIRAGMPTGRAFETWEQVSVESTQAPADTISVTLTVSDSFLSDVLTTAVEGGSNYWARFSKAETVEREYSHVYTAVTVCGNAETRDDFEAKRIGLSELREGVRVMLERGKCATSYRETLIGAILENDAGACDADIADLILQSAMFDGEVIFG